MKKTIQFIALAFFATLTSARAQDQTTTSKFGFIGNYKIGGGTLEHNQIGNLSGNLASLEAMVYLKAIENTKVGIGASYLQFQSNFFDGALNSSLTNTYLQIPATITHRLSLHKNDSEDKVLHFVIGLGIYANNLISSEIKNLDQSVRSKNQGWNFGNTVEIGFEYVFSDQVHFGLYAQNLNDWNAIKKDGVEQKLTDSNLIKFGVGVSF